MKDAKGHGSDPRGGLSPTEQRMATHGANVIAAMHGIATDHLQPQERPTPQQFQDYRAGRRDAVTRIAKVVKSGTIPRSTWARSAVLRARADHSASIKRQFGG